MEENVEYRGYTIRIERDEDALCPRTDWDPLGHMICFHPRYNLGDTHNYADPDDFFKSLAVEIDPTVEDRLEYWDQMAASKPFPESVAFYEEHEKRIISKALEKAAILPLYLYDHGGITMRTGPFACGWDSGKVGYIYITHEEIKKELCRPKWTKKNQKNPKLLPIKIITAADRQMAVDRLKSEVKTYDHYLTGEVYGFTIENEDGDEIDSCWGFYGDPEDHMIPECKATIDSDIIESERKRRKDFQQALSKRINQVKAWIKHQVPLIYRHPWNYEY